MPEVLEFPVHHPGISEPSASDGEAGWHAVPACLSYECGVPSSNNCRFATAIRSLGWEAVTMARICR